MEKKQKLIKVGIEEKVFEYKDETKTLEERKDLYKSEVLNKLLNPIENFNPETFDPLEDNTEEYKLAKRVRKLPPIKLPTMGLSPKEILDGQMIGMYESKQDIYLILAHRCNDLQDEVDTLKKELIKINKIIK